METTTKNILQGLLVPGKFTTERTERDRKEEDKKKQSKLASHQSSSSSVRSVFSVAISLLLARRATL
jgi:hypothetical protein